MRTITIRLVHRNGLDMEMDRHVFVLRHGSFKEMVAICAKEVGAMQDNIPEYQRDMLGTVEITVTDEHQVI